MKDVIKFNGHLYQKLEEGAYTIQGEVIEVVRSQGGGKEAEIERILFSLYHEPMPPYEWAEQKLMELVSRPDASPSDEKVKELFYKVQKGYHPSRAMKDYLELARPDASGLVAALEEMVYETTHLSAREEDGSHWCKISKKCLEKAREALHRFGKEGRK